MYCLETVRCSATGTFHSVITYIESQGIENEQVTAALRAIAGMCFLLASVIASFSLPYLFVRTSRCVRVDCVFVCAEAVFAQFQQLMDRYGTRHKREAKLAAETQLLLVQHLLHTVRIVLIRCSLGSFLRPRDGCA